MSTLYRQADYGGQYEIRVKGTLSQDCADWFDGFTITSQANGETVLAGAVPDRAALRDLISKIFLVGLGLVSV